MSHLIPDLTPFSLCPKVIGTSGNGAAEELFLLKVVVLEFMGRVMWQVNFHTLIKLLGESERH